MAQARLLTGASPSLFIDAQKETPHVASGAPVPGLTVLDFPNNHLSYAITWFALALVSAGGAVVLWRRSP
jgi:surfeit locus 1 family protein